jgi:hypothetical protein
MKMQRKILFISLLAIGILVNNISLSIAQSSATLPYQFYVQFNHEDSVQVMVFENTADSYEVVFVNSANPFNISIALVDLQEYMALNYHLIYPVPQNEMVTIEYYPIISGLSYMLVVLRNATAVLTTNSAFMIRSDITIHSSNFLSAEGDISYIGSKSAAVIEQDSNIYGTVFRVDLLMDGRIYTEYGIFPLQEQDIVVWFNTQDLEVDWYSCYVRVYYISPNNEVHTMDSQPFGIDVRSRSFIWLQVAIAVVVGFSTFILYFGLKLRHATFAGAKYGLREKLKNKQTRKLTEEGITVSNGV